MWHEAMRTREKGMRTVRLNGKQIGKIKGTKVKSKESTKAKEEIKKNNKAVADTLNDKKARKLVGISKVTFYEFKKVLENDNFLIFLCIIVIFI